MTSRKYYAERKDLLTPVPIDFEMLKKAFLLIFERLENEFYLREATGYECVDSGIIRGTWGSDIEAFLYLQLRMRNVWPIPEKIHNYDEPTLFTVIEFLYDHVSEPQHKFYHEWDNCGWHTSDYDRDKGKERFKKEMNEILKDYDSGFILSDTGEILHISPTGLETVVVVETNDPEKIDNRVHTAIIKYRRYNATLDDKKEAIRVLADILEYLKSQDVKLPSKDDSDLFNIINNFDIRHHNKLQHSAYDRTIWYDWMFYTFLSSINVLLKLR